MLILNLIRTKKTVNNKGDSCVTSKKVVVYGAGPYGRIFLADVRMYNKIEVVAFTVDKKYLKEITIDGIPVVEFEKVSEIYPPTEYDMIVVCGYTRMRNRKQMYLRAKNKGYNLINYISPGARIEGSFSMGDNNVVLSGAEIGMDGVMGNNNFINQNVYLAHQFHLEDHIIISAGCIIGGYSTIEELSFCGFGVKTEGFIHIGKECLVGMGSVVVRDINDYATAYGVPAREVSFHKESGVIIDEYKKLGKWNVINE